MQNLQKNVPNRTSNLYKNDTVSYNGNISIVNRRDILNAEKYSEEIQNEDYKIDSDQGTNGDSDESDNLTYDKLTSELCTLSSNHLSYGTKVKAIYQDQKQCVDVILGYDSRITEISQQLGVPKEMIQAIMYRELTCMGADDIAADVAVAAGLRKDSSTGIGQVFAETAIKAEKIVNGDKELNPENKDDIKKVWQWLQDDNTNIYYIGLVLKSIAIESKIDLSNVSRQQMEAIIARYNGFGSDAARYGSQTMQYYDLFKRYKQN
jgi:hypothetical protein